MLYVIFNFNYHTWKNIGKKLFPVTEMCSRTDKPGIVQPFEKPNKSYNSYTQGLIAKNSCCLKFPV